MLMRIRVFLNAHRAVVIAAAAVVVLAAGYLAYSRLGSKNPAQPEVAYTCQDGHTWKEAPSAAPRCPQCGAPGITKLYFTCRKCGKKFLGLETKIVGPGKRRYRGAGSNSWVGSPPRRIRCPCGKAGPLDGGPFKAIKGAVTDAEKPKPRPGRDT